MLPILAEARAMLFNTIEQARHGHDLHIRCTKQPVYS
jgi:hypothetical protein